MRRAARRTGSLSDVLVNNAGANWGAPLEEFPDAAWDKVLTLNLTRVFSLTQQLVPLLEAANEPGKTSFENAGGRVIMIGSVDGACLRGICTPFAAAYVRAAAPPSSGRQLTRRRHPSPGAGHLLVLGKVRG